MSSPTISPQEGTLRTDFLKDNASTLIQYDVQEFVKWHGITIPCTRQDAVLIPAKTAKVFYIKIKNPEVKTGLVPRLHLGNGLFAGNKLVKSLVKNHGGRAYIKIINTRDNDERIIALEVELEELDNIVASRSKKPSPRDRNVQMHAVNVIATDDTQNTRNRCLREHSRLDYLNKEETAYVDRIINKYSDLFQLPDELLGHTDITKIPYNQNYTKLSQPMTDS